MKTQAKAFNLSLTIHAFIFLMITAADTYMTSPKPPMVIDFTIDSAPGRPDLKSPEPEIKKPKPAAVKRQLAAKEPVKETIKEKPVEPVQEIKQALAQESPVSLPVKEEEKQEVIKKTERVSDKPLPALQASTPKVHSNTAPDPLNADANGVPSGRGTSQEGEKARYLKENFAYIRDIIQRKTAYPLIARKMGWEGKVTVSFIVSSDGRVRDVKIKEGSGFEILDKNALTAVFDASPFPKPPIEAQFIVPIKYTLN